jgi:hypothetical protein
MAWTVWVVGGPQEVRAGSLGSGGRMGSLCNGRLMRFELVWSGY